MKNPLALCLVLICCACVAFTAGLFVGRNADRTQIQLADIPTKPAATESSPPEDNAGPAAQVDINTATLAQLQTLPGIGQTLAQRIIDYREANGAFTDVAQLTNVEGIGAKKLEAMIDYITVGG